jgi:SnoaL-like domain
MTRLGSWNPSSLHEKIDRLDSLAEIRQLPPRYALAVDSRDLDTLVSLFLADVRVGRDRYGRDALKEWFTSSLTRMKATIHFVGNHVVDFDDPDHGHGIVYCRDELERPEQEEWQIGVIQYWDTYRRVDGEWFFERRKLHRWYIGDALTRPAHGLGVGGEGLKTPQLPEAFATWAPFWAGRDG